MEDSVVTSNFRMARGFPLIVQTNYAMLAKPFSCDEVKQVLCQMNLNKAPSLDGFQVGFYKKLWNIVKESVRKFAKVFFLFYRGFTSARSQ